MASKLNFSAAHIAPDFQKGEAAAHSKGEAGGVASVRGDGRGVGSGGADPWSGRGWQAAGAEGRGERRPPRLAGARERGGAGRVGED